MPPAPIVEPSTIDTSKVLFDIEGIRQHNPQRLEMEQLTAVLHIDPEQALIIGYKDVTDQEFWVRGHMPEFPLMPGVLICEVAAQLCSLYCSYIKLIPGSYLGFGGIEDVRFRGQVMPGDRLLMMGRGVRVHRRQSIFETQAFVKGNMVYHGRVIGVPLPAQMRPPV